MIIDPASTARDCLQTSPDSHTSDANCGIFLLWHQLLISFLALCVSQFLFWFLINRQLLPPSSSIIYRHLVAIPVSQVNECRPDKDCPLLRKKYSRDCRCCLAKTRDFVSHQTWFRACHSPLSANALKSAAIASLNSNNLLWFNWTIWSDH